MRVVIVDDEPVARRGLRRMLLRHPDATVVGEARNGAEAVRILATLSPDVVLLDVQMPGGDGFEVLRRLPSTPPMVVFITAYDDFAVRAFEAHALDYLVKPVREDRFDAALDRCRHRMRSVEALRQAERIAHMLQTSDGAASAPPPVPVTRLVVSDPNGEVVVPAADITWIEAEDYYAAVHARGRRYLLRESLDSLERRLDPWSFVRVHRSAIVNLLHVRGWRRDAGVQVLALDDGRIVPVSRRRRGLVSDAIRKFAGAAR